MKYLYIVPAFIIFGITFGNVARAATVCAPTNLQAQNTFFSTSQQIVWDSPDPKNQPGCVYPSATIKTYHVYVGEAGKTRTLYSSPGTGGIETVQNLKPGTKYDFSVNVEYADGTLSSEAVLSGVLLADTSTFCSVTNLSAGPTPGGPDGSATFEWSESCPSSAKPLGYEIWASDILVKSVAESGTHYVETVKLSPGTYYSIRVYPKYTNVGAAYGYTSVTTSGTPVPSALLVKTGNPSQLSITSRNTVTNGFSLSWIDASGVTPQEKISSYALYYAEYNADGTAKSPVLATTLGSVTSYYLSSLRQTSSYKIILKGFNSAGQQLTESVLDKVSLNGVVSPSTTTVATSTPVTGTPIPVSTSSGATLTTQNCVIAVGASVCSAKPVILMGYTKGLLYDLYNVATYVTTSNAFNALNDYSFSPSWTGNANELRYGANILQARAAGSSTVLATITATASCSSGSSWNGAVCATTTATTTPVMTTAKSSLTSAQVQAILSVLTSFGADEATIARVSSALSGTATAQASAAAQAFCYNFTSDLTVGSSGSAVLALNQILNQELAAQGIRVLSESSLFDENTANTVVSLQAKYGIRQTGYVGPLTRAKLNSVYGCK